MAFIRGWMKLLLFVFTALQALSALAQFQVIYGEDNRQEVFEAKPLYQSLARSTAIMMETKSIQRNSKKPGVVTIDQGTMREWMDGKKKIDPLISLPQKAQRKSTFCADMKFVDQPNAGSCGGFLIAPDLLMTAGHCLTVKNFCEDNVWVFDYQIDPVTKKAGVAVPEENIYRCKRVVSGTLLMSRFLDYGVVQLERVAIGRQPLKIRMESKAQVGDPLVVIGSPSGLPMKVADGATVRSDDHPHYFKANLDTFEGNSGSPVVNAETGVVEGVIVRGEDDFQTHPTLMCTEAKQCDDNGCRGEDVSRVSSVPEVNLYPSLMSAAVTGNLKLLSKIISLGTWIDFYLADGQSALLKAAGAHQVDVIKYLLDHDANPKLVDVKGNSALHLLALAVPQVDVSEAISLFLAAGVDPDLRNGEGKTALEIALQRGHVIAMRALSLAF